MSKVFEYNEFIHGEIIKSGYLYKTGSNVHMRNCFMKRFFKLIDHNLYYSNRESTDIKDIKGIIDLRKATINPFTFSDKMGFQLILKNKKIYNIKCETEELSIIWIETISRVIIKEYNEIEENDNNKNEPE